MAYQTVFKRYELKYLLTPSQAEHLLSAIQEHMVADRYGKSTVRNLYFDTDDYRLIRRSIEKPVYKEKMRMRSYAQAEGEDKVFVELKKKYEGIVYKRRISLCERDAMAWTRGEIPSPVDTQISREIDYFMRYYGTLTPKVFLSYEREAYYDKNKSGFRVTFDRHILAREEALSLSSPAFGTPLLPEGCVLMELKCALGMPLWMAELLSRERIFKVSFSKYGTAYSKLIFPRLYTPNFITSKEFSKDECSV